MIMITIIIIFVLIVVYAVETDTTKERKGLGECHEELRLRNEKLDARHEEIVEASRLRRHYSSVWVCRTCDKEHESSETNCSCGMSKADSEKGNWICHNCGKINLGTGFFANAVCDVCGEMWLSSKEDEKAAILKKYYCDQPETNGCYVSLQETNLIPSPGEYGSESIKHIKSEKTSDYADLEGDEFINSISGEEEQRVDFWEEMNAQNRDFIMAYYENAL